MSPTPGGKVSKHLTEVTKGLCVVKGTQNNNTYKHSLLLSLSSPNHRQQPVLAKMVNLQVMDDKCLPIAPSALYTLIFNSDP